MGSAEIQAQMWGARANDWANAAEGTSVEMFNRILDKTEVNNNTVLLDIGCGSGMFCQMAANRGAKVHGIDASERLAAIARQRVPKGNFETGEMEELPYPDSTFNLVTGINSFQFAENKVNALREAKRVAQSGAQVLTVVWGKPEDCEATPIMKAIGMFLPPPPQDNTGRKPLFSEGVLEDLASQAGLKPENVEEIKCSWDFEEEEEMLKGMLSAGLATIAIQQAGEHTVREAIRKEIQRFKTPDGRIHLSNTFRCLVSRA